MKFFRNVVPSTFISILLLISFNLNSFAAPTSFSVNIADCNPSVTKFAANTDEPISITEYCQFYKRSNDSHFGGLPYTQIIINNGYHNDTRVGFRTSLSFRSNCQYDLDFYFAIYQNLDPTSVSNLYLYMLVGNSNGDSALVEIVNIDVTYEQEYHIQTDFNIPDISGASYIFLFRLYNYLGTETNDYSNFHFRISDLNFKKYNEIDEAFSNVIYPATADEFNNMMNDYNAVMEELPTVEVDDIENILDYDFSGFNNGLSFVRELFERTMNTFNFNIVLAFALCIGFTTYVLGRKVG